MIQVGTCSWTEKTLIQSGEFYPKGIKTAEDRLRYYASRFSTVEIDSTYYAIPNIKNTYLWVNRTPEDFIFHIKVYGALTGHGIEPRTLPADIYNLLAEKDRSEKYVYVKEPTLLKIIADRFIDVLSPLVKAGKMGVLVFQFPPWFQYRTKNMDDILIRKELLQGLTMAVEFRHGSWLTQDVQKAVFQFLKKNQITYITADEPQYNNLATIPFLPERTTDTAYFRFHGRNKENWLKKGIETSLKFSYLYSDGELKEFIPPVRETERGAKVTYAMFNNCHGGFAMKNALRMKEFLSSEERSNGR
jgi:uncharacterized protein YecE (DUF72 family)